MFALFFALNLLNILLKILCPSSKVS